MIGWGKEMRPALLLHRTARAVPLACGHAMRGLDERGMAPPAPSLYQYPRFLCAFAPWRENVFITQRRKGDSTPDDSHLTACIRTQNQAIPPIGPSYQDSVTR